MIRREAVIAALHHQAVSPIPYHIEFTGQSLEKLIRATNNPAIEERIGTYLHYIQYWGWPTEIQENPGHFRDEFGVVWNRGGADKDIGVVEDPQVKDLENCDYRFPEPDIERLRGDIEQMLSTRKDRFTFMGFGFCMFERAWSLMGMENTLINMITNPDELEAFFDRICEFFLALVDIALEYDVDGVYFGDDWGQQRGLIMGPANWRRFIKPRMARLYDRVKAGGKYVVQHSCGDNNDILGDLIEIGLDCYQTFQPEIYDIDQVKKKYGDRLTFWGGISTQRVLPVFKPGELREEIVRVVKILRKDGGLIIAPTHALPFDVPVENILAMAEVFQNQDRYF
jgi:uroporphyrinogen decarboxylase